jgi:uncharacterized coiled-coil protein SlyX
MKKFCTTFLASVMLLALSAPAWAHGTFKGKQQCLTKNDTHYGHYHYKHNRHKLRVLKQFRLIKKVYNKSTQDARQMFLEYVGSSLPGSDTDVEALRQEYDQQIADLNKTITTQQQQITDLNTTITSQQQQITGLNTTITSQKQQLDDANATILSLQDQLKTQDADYQQQLADLRQQCSDAADTAYNDGKAAGMETCASTGSPGNPQLSNSWSTGANYPYALDVDGQGNTYILDKTYRTVVGYDSSGSQITSWTPASLSYPVDIAVDSQGAIYVLDQGSPNFLQKFDSGGQLQTFPLSYTDVNYPLGLFIDSQDNIYITDLGGTNGSRVLKYNATGTLQTTIGDVSDPDLAGDEYTDVAVDGVNQIVYVVTHYNHMVGKFGMDGTLLGKWQGDLRNPNSIAIGAQGQVFIADTYNDQIDQYDADGNLTDTISAAEISRPHRIVVDTAGKLYIADESYQMVQVYQ